MRTLPWIVLVAAACTRSPTEVNPAPETPKSAAPSSVAPSGEPPLVAHIEGHVGERVAIDVRPATIVAQHLVGAVAGKNGFYAVSVEGGLDFVAYVASEPACAGTIRLVGVVTSIQGGGKKQKSEETFHETQLDVERWSCR